MNNLDEWKKDVTQFLSSRRKYRGGPTLLDELYCRNKGKSDYILIGIVCTPIIAFSSGLISFIATRKVGFSVAIASSMAVLGIIATFAIDYRMTKRKEEKITEEECIELLKALERMPKWWPWIGEEQADELYAEGLRHLYNYRKLGGKIMLGFNIMGSWNAVKRKIYGSSPNQETVETAKECEENKIEETSKVNRLIKTIYRVKDGEMSLKQVLDQFDYKWLLLHFDRSLIGIKEQKKTMEEHDKYVQSMIKKLQKLSLAYHPDRQESNNDQAQKMINQTVDALRNIHEYVMKMGKASERQASLCSYIESQECYFVYRMYNDIPLSTLSSDQDVSEIVKISPIDGMSALFELSILADQEEGDLMVARNQYLRDAAVSVNSLSKKTQGMKTASYKELSSLKEGIELTWKTFDEAYNKYIERYYEKWVEYLEMLNERCEKSGLLKVIQPGVEELWQESDNQYEILLGQSYRAGADEEFVLPMIEYHNLMGTYYKFATYLLKERENCYRFYGYSCSMPALGEVDFILEKEREDTKFLKETKESIRNNLYSRELLCDVKELVSAYIKNDANELKEKIGKYYKKDEENGEKKEIGNVVLFILEYLEGLLSNKFKEKKTSFERKKEELEQIIKERKAAEAMADEERTRADEERTRADRSELKDRTRKVIMRQIRKLDDELGDIVVDNQDQIVDAIVNYAMENRQQSPEPIVSAVMEEIRFNREQVIREGINAGLIDTGIRSFLTDVSVEPGTSHASEVDVDFNL